MNPKKLFFSQTILDGLITEGKIKLNKNILTLLSTGNPSFVLEPAYRIVKTADNGPDPHGLTGRIRYEKELKAENAEIYLDSLIYQNTAYQVEPGFIGEKEDFLDRLSDTELLAKFLLDNLI